MAAKVKWGANHHTAQIYSHGPELALVSDENEQIGTFVFCKDFFQDAIVAALHGTVCGIYGYTYDPKKSAPVPTKNVKVALVNGKDKDFKNKLAGLTDFLHQFEVEAKSEKSTVEVCNPASPQYPNGSFLVTGDKCWLMSPPLLSGWTLIVRNGLQHKLGDKWRDTVKSIIAGKTPPAQANDHLYLQHGLPGLDLIIKEGIPALFGTDQKVNYPKEKAGAAMHHYSGIVSYGSKKAQPHFPNWKYPEAGSNPPGVCFS